MIACANVRTQKHPSGQGTLAGEHTHLSTAPKDSRVGRCIPNASRDVMRSKFTNTDEVATAYISLRLAEYECLMIFAVLAPQSIPMA